MWQFVIIAFFICAILLNTKEEPNFQRFVASWQASNILQDVIDLSSDSEDEVIVHWSPGLQFLDDEEFILCDLHQNAAPAAPSRLDAPSQ